MLRSILRVLVPLPVGSTRTGWRPLLRASRLPGLAWLVRRRVGHVTHGGVADLAMGEHHPVNLGLGDATLADGGLDTRLAGGIVAGVLAHRCRRPGCAQVRFTAALHTASLTDDPAAGTLARLAASHVGADAFSIAPLASTLDCIYSGFEPLDIALVAGVTLETLFECDEGVSGSMFYALGADRRTVALLAAHLGFSRSSPASAVLDACHARLTTKSAWPLLHAELAAVSHAPAALGPILASFDAIGDVVTDVAALRAAGAPGSLEELASIAR